MKVILRLFVRSFIPVFLFLFLSAPSNLQAESTRLERRLNKILYWRIADDLKLDAKTESKMVSILEELNALRKKAMKNKVDALEKMKDCKGASEKKKKESKECAKKCLSAYVKAGKDLHQVDADEVQKLTHLLGAEKVVRFFVIRRQMAGEIKKALK